MKTIFSLIFCMVLAYGSFAQISGKTLNSKTILSKDFSNVISVKPGYSNLKSVKLPKNFDINKIKELKIPKDKLKLPSRKNVKITPKKPYHPYLKLTYEGKYNSNYFTLTHNEKELYEPVKNNITINAQRGKEYRIKISLTDKKYLMQDLGADFPNGSVLILLGKSYDDDWYRVSVDQRTREINFILKATQAGMYQIFITGIYGYWDSSDEVWLPVKSIQVDEI